METSRIHTAIERAYQAQEELKKAMFELTNSIYEDTQSKAFNSLKEPEREGQQGLTLSP